MLERIDNPFVEALVVFGGGGRDLAVKLWRKTEIELAGVWLLGFYASLSAVFEVFVYGGMEARNSLRNSLAVKADDIVLASGQSVLLNRPHAGSRHQVR